MAKCDLCGESCKAVELAQLLKPYQEAGVVDICRRCEKWANKLKSDILAELAPRMRGEIATRKGFVPATPSKNWWRGFMEAR